MRIFLRSSLLIFSLAVANLAFAQVSNSTFVQLLNKVSRLPVQENVYLHFDKQYYVAGDTVYFKCYAAMGNRHVLTTISNVLYVDLINAKNVIDKSIKLQLADGVAWGDFTLADSLPKGRYHIRAYTQWMRNEGNYFDQIIPVGSLTDRDNASGNSTSINASPDLQFFPEGGELIAGISSKLAFKVTADNGLSMDVNGTVTDDNGRQIARFASTHLGMGYFNFRPEPGRSYKAAVKYSNGGESVVNLPVAKLNGLSLAVGNDSLSVAALRISTSEAYLKENKNKLYHLLIFSGGTSTTVNFKLDSTVTLLNVLKRHLHTGVTRITVVSQDAEPLCERLIFVQNYDQLKLEISTEKKTLSQREHVIVNLNAVNRAGLTAAGHFSVSVTDESKLPADDGAEHTILTDLLLTSELTGHIEKPNYYFRNIDQHTTADLDLVMLTHGYRRFKWQQILSDNFPLVKWQPESGLQIKGMAKSLSGRPLKNGTVSLIAIKSNGFLAAKTDSTGHFSFRNLTFFDSTQFVLQAANARGKNFTKIFYQREPAAPSIDKVPVSNNDNVNHSMPDYLKNKEKEQEELNRWGSGRGTMLKEVKIRYKKPDNNYRTQSLAGAGFADQVMHSKEIGEIQGPLSVSLNGRLHGVVLMTISGKVEALLHGESGMLIIIDGVEGADMSSLNANQVETVEVLKSSNASIYGMAGGHGVIVITTKEGGVDPKDIPSVGILPMNIQGYYKPREFYSPKYTATSIDGLSDLRATIFWKPELLTGKNGTAAFDYYNAGNPGTYRVEIEGIDENGNLGYQVYRYKVE